MQPRHCSSRSRFPVSATSRWDPEMPTSDTGSWDNVLDAGMAIPLWAPRESFTMDVKVGVFLMRKYWAFSLHLRAESVEQSGSRGLTTEDCMEAASESTASAWNKHKVK